MRDFTFLHMADLHLGSPFEGLGVDDPATASRFAQAIRDTFTALVARAIAEAVDFVVIAGDVYDREWRDASVGLFFNREMARLDRAGIPVFVIKGNHDAASVVISAVPLPASVREFGSDAPTTRTIPHLKVALHGISYEHREAPQNLARAYPDALPDHFNIGLLHTSLTGEESNAVYAPCTEADLVAKGYDYWALGHVHRPQSVRENPAIVFSGCIQGRSVRELGPHGAALVRVANGETALEWWMEDRVRWCEARVPLDGVDDFAAEGPALIERAVRDAVEGVEGRPVALRVVLEGRTAVHAWLHASAAEARALVQATADHVVDDIWLEKLRLRTEPRQASALDGEALATLLDTVDGDAVLRGSVEKQRAQLLAKAPPEIDASDLDTDALLADARALLSAKLAG